MHRIAALLALLGVFASAAGAQNLAPRFSHGPSLPFTTIQWDETGKAHAGLVNAGAGYNWLNVNLLDSPDGAVRWVTIGLPAFVNAVGSEFRFAQGLTVGTYNNLFSLGAALDFARVADAGDSGLLIDPGALTRQNVMLLFAFNFNLGGGQAAAPQAAAVRKAAGAPAEEPPPCYLRLRR